MSPLLIIGYFLPFQGGGNNWFCREPHKHAFKVWSYLMQYFPRSSKCEKFTNWWRNVKSRKYSFPLYICLKKGSNFVCTIKLMYRACFLNGLLHMFTRKKNFWKVQRRCVDNYEKSLRTDGKTLSDGKSSHDLFGQISKTVKYPIINNGDMI
jgi:hypothetical protein